MGYKLAGCHVVGGVEIDKHMMQIYRTNHNPEQSYLMDIRDFNKILPDIRKKDLPDIDILDGSPPCSAFSIAGSRSEKWGKAFAFKEGQAKQRLDDLFSHFIETARILRPKIVIAENVEGLILGKAKGFVKEIFKLFALAGYKCQLFLLNASVMGVPQARKRVFFIASRHDLQCADISLSFNNPIIPVASFAPRLRDYKMVTAGNTRDYAFGRQKNPWPCISKPAPTQTATPNQVDAAIRFPGNGSFIQPTKFLDSERIAIQSFPYDFNFCGKKVSYVCGMSVPPVMMYSLLSQCLPQMLGFNCHKLAEA